MYTFCLQPLFTNGKTSCRKISWSLSAARFGFRLFQSLWNIQSRGFENSQDLVVRRLAMNFSTKHMPFWLYDMYYNISNRVLNIVELSASNKLWYLNWCLKALGTKAYKSWLRYLPTKCQMAFPIEPIHIYKVAAVVDKTVSFRYILWRHVS